MKLLYLIFQNREITIANNKEYEKVIQHKIDFLSQYYRFAGTFILNLVAPEKVLNDSFSTA